MSIACGIMGDHGGCHYHPLPLLIITPLNVADFFFPDPFRISFWHDPFLPFAF